MHTILYRMKEKKKGKLVLRVKYTHQRGRHTQNRGTGYGKEMAILLNT